MFHRHNLSKSSTRYAIVGTMILLLLAAAPLASAMGNELEGTLLRTGYASARGWSGDDQYDPAAGSNPDRVAANAQQAVLAMTGSRSGDDLYDSAAGSIPGQAATNAERAVLAMTGSRSGDDFDPAAGSSLEQLASAATAVSGAPVSCGLSAAEIAERSGRSIPGGFSGDDDYDPAAGGIPEVSQLAAAGDLGLLAACAPTMSGN